MQRGQIRKQRLLKRTRKHYRGEDVIIFVNNENKEYAKWGKANWDSEGPLFKSKLAQAFTFICFGTRTKQWEDIKLFAKNTKNVHGGMHMSESTFSFRVWMNDNRKSKKSIDARICKVLDEYANNVMNQRDCSDTEDE